MIDENTKKTGCSCKTKKMGDTTIMDGLPACPGIVHGVAIVIGTVPSEEDIRKIKADPRDKKILVIKNLSSEYANLLRGIGFVGLVSETGGITAHLAIIAREMKIPHVSGIEMATSDINTGDDLLVDGHHGLVVANKECTVNLCI